MQKRRNKLQDSQQWQDMQFQNGKVHSYFPLPSNKIISKNYHSQYLLIGLVIGSLGNLSCLSLLATILTIIFIPQSVPFSLSLYLTQLIVLMIVLVIKEIYFDNARGKSDQKINTRKVKVHRGKQFFQSMNWQDLRQGDIVYLTQGEVVPADIILLDSQQIQHRQAVTYIDIRNVNGKTTAIKKKACYLTQMLTRGAMQKLNWENYQKVITGKLSFQKSTENLQNFTGYLKLTKDPKVQKLTANNLILRESILKTSLWVYGLVIYTGMNSKIMKNRNSTANVKGIFNNRLDVIFGICFCFNIVFGILFSFLYLYRSTDRPFFVMVSYHFQMFSILLPHSLYIFHNFYLICYSFFYKEEGLEIRNYENLHTLGQIDIAILADNGVINSGNLVVDQIVTPSAVYNIKSNDATPNSKKKKTLLRRNASSNEKDLTSQVFKKGEKRLNPFSNINNQLFLQNSMQEDEKFQIQDGSDVRMKLPALGQFPKLKAHQLQPLKINKIGLLNQVNQGGQQATDIIKSFVLCNQAKFFYNSQSQTYDCTSNITSEEVLLKLAKDMGWEISPKMDLIKEVGLLVKEYNWMKGKDQVKKNHSYLWVGINSFQISRKLFSVVVKDQKKIVLYCKGKAEDILERLTLSKENQKIIDTTLASYKNKKAETIIYGKKYLTQEQMEFYESQYTNLKYSLTTTENQIEQFSKKWQNKLQFISIVSLSSQMNVQSKKLVKNLSESGIKICMISNNDLELDTFKSAFEFDQQTIEFINFDNSTTQLTRYYLNEVTRKIKAQSKYCFGIIINGSTWNLLVQNPNIMQHFLFVIYYCQGLIVYNFTPQQTAQMTIKLKASYPKQQKILAIGNSYEDLKFEDQADLSISVGSYLPTDVNTQTLEDAIKLISYGPKILQAYVSIINLVLYRLVSLVTVILIFQIALESFNASYTLDKTLVFIIVVIYNFSEISFSIYTMKIDQVNNQKLAYYSNFKKLYRKVLITVFQAFIHGGIIIGAVLSIIPQARLAGGKILSAGAFHMAIFILLILVSNCRNIFRKGITRLRFIVLSIKNISFCSLSLFVGSMIDPTFKQISKQILPLISTYDCITMMINTLFLCLAISFFIEEVIMKYVFPEIKDQYTQDCQSKQILKDIRKDQERVELIKYLFKEQENIQSSICQCVGDKLDINSLKINKMVQIRNKQANIKNLYENHKRNSLNFIQTLILSAIIQVILAIIDMAVLKDPFASSLIPFIFGVILTVPVCLYIKYGQIKMNYYPLAEVTLAGLCIIFCVFAIIAKDQTYFLVFCFLSIVTTQLLEIRMIILALISGSIIIANTVLLLVSSKSSGQIALQILFTLICVIVNMFILRNSLIESKINFIKNQAFEKQTHYVNDILSILVPKFVKKHLENYTQNFALQQKQNKVSVLFCYVCNFQAIVKEQGKNVVLIMDQLFRQFDQLCHNFAVQKIQTVGFTYMAATGIKVVEDQMENQFIKKNQVERLLKMSIQMLDKAKSVSWGLKKDKRLTIKVGIHHGDVVIGVIGYHKPQFSLIGDTVNTTSRHCTTGQTGDITLSSVAYQMLKKFSHNSFTKKQKQMKGLGNVNVYVYNKIDDINSKHMLIKMKFRNGVNKVIQILKNQGKIKYKLFKAADIANKLAQQVQREKQRKNSHRRTTQQRRSSINKIQQLMQDIQKDKSQSIQGKPKDRLMPNNWCLELQQRNPEYYTFVKKKHSTNDKILLIVILPIMTLNIIYNLVSVEWDSKDIVVRVLSIVVYGACVYFYRAIFRADWYLWLFVLGMAFVIVVENLAATFAPQLSPNYAFVHFKEYFPMICLTILSATQGFRFLQIAVLCIFSVVISIIDNSIRNQFQIGVIYEIFYYVFILYRKYMTVRESYNNYIQMINYQKRNKQQSDLVSQLLPKHAYQKLKNQNIQNRLQLTDQFQKCTMLYADIKGFTAFSKKHENQPDVIVQMLRKLFQQFDKKCLQYNVYKVYTIGDCYVVLGFTNCYQRDFLQQAKNVVNMGLGMVDHIQSVREKFNFDQLDMRIGIHTGTVIGGIIGTEIVRYDIYGPDVMITNKFQEKGETGHIHISQATKEILDQDKKSPYNIIPHGKVKIQKLNAQYNGYLLSKKKFQL